LISDLPEEEYNKLVVQARDFSLAKSSLALAMLNNNNHQRPTTAISGSAISSSAFNDLQYIDMEEEVGPGKLRRVKQTSMHSVERTSRHMSPYGKTVEQPECNDSGVFNASKITTGSISDPDLPDNNFNAHGRVGCYDYIDSPLTETNSYHSSRANFNRVVSNKEQEHLHDKAYDDSYDAESDTEKPESSNCFDSPTEFEIEAFKGEKIAPDENEDELCDFDKILRNENIRQKNTETYDEAHLYDSDNSGVDLESVVVEPTGDEYTCTNNVHKILYTQANHFSSMDTEYNHDYVETISRAKSSYGSSSGGPREKDLLFTSSPNYGGTRHYTTPSSRSVDSAVSFPLSRNKNSTSEGVKISEKVVKRHDMGGPPFGDPLCLTNLSRATTERLIDGRGTRSENIHNLPRAAPISERGQLELGGAYSMNNGDKKKKKKKKDSKGMIF
jgi:hypothetical protein